MADLDLQLAAAQAGRDLERREVDVSPLDLAQRLGDLRLGDAEQAQRVALKRRRARRAPRGRAPTPAPPATSPAARAAAPAGRSPWARRWGPPGRARSPPGRSSVAPRGTIACLRLASRSASASKRSRRAKPREDAGDLLLHPLVEDQLPAGEPGDHLGRQVVGRRAEARRWSRSGRRPGRRGTRAPPRGRGRGLPTQRMWVTSTPSSPSRSEIQGPFRSVTRPVSDLGAGDDDPGANRVAHGAAHGQLGPLKLVGRMPFESIS